LFNSNLGIAVGAFDAVTAGVAIGSASIGCGFAAAIVSAAVGVLVLIFDFLEKCF
jgi:hypothetical protein